MDFYIELNEDEYELIKNLDTSLGMWFWNMAVMIAPYDTGNLRKAISLNSNTSKKITIRYNTMQANYIKFLEEGVGPVKKHKDFIGVKTRLAITEELISYLKTGRKPMFTSVPFVATRSSGKVFSREKAFLRQADMHTNAITQKARNKIASVRETQYRKEHGIALTNFSGLKVESGAMQKQALKGSTRGISLLSQAYQDAKRLT